MGKGDHATILEHKKKMLNVKVQIISEKVQPIQKEKGHDVFNMKEMYTYICMYSIKMQCTYHLIFLIGTLYKIISHCMTAQKATPDYWAAMI